MNRYSQTQLLSGGVAGGVVGGVAGAVEGTCPRKVVMMIPHNQLLSSVEVVVLVHEVGVAGEEEGTLLFLVFVFLIPELLHLVHLVGFQMYVISLIMIKLDQLVLLRI
jgi:hypothetical protein